MNTIKNLILDLGGVLFDLDYELTRQAFFKLGLGDNFSKLKQSSLFDDIEEGKVSPTDFYSTLIKSSTNHLPPTIQELKDAWNLMLLGMKSTQLELLLQLKEQYRLFLYSNTNAIHIQAVWESLQLHHGIKNLDDYFNKVYLSHELEIRKPKPAGFLHIVSEHNLIKAETLFIDDSPQHVKGAKEAGIHALYLDLEKQDLKSLLIESNLLDD